MGEDTKMHGSNCFVLESEAGEGSCKGRAAGKENRAGGKAPATYTEQCCAGQELQAVTGIPGKKLRQQRQRLQDCGETGKLQGQS